MSNTQKNIEDLCHVVKHPVLQHKLTMIRKKETNHAEFRRILSEIASLLAYEATKDLKLQQVEISTPLEKTEQPLVGERIILIPIQRAGSGMLEGMLEMLPFARVGHIGIYRDKMIHATVEYYFRIPNNCQGQRVFLIDPLLATGDTAVAAIDRLKQYEVGPITFICVLSAPEGIRQLKAAHPDVQIITTNVDRQLSPKGYILPGLGDAGDRLFDTL
jgi:uracil phosphoribosyltransferase